MTLELRATPQEVMRGVETLQELLRQQQLGEREIFGLALALEECGSNIVNHSYRHDERQTFRVAIDCKRDHVTLELRDHGPEFDPTLLPPPPPMTDEDDRPPGGWGIHLVRHYMDEMIYRREGGENVLRLTKRRLP